MTQYLVDDLNPTGYPQVIDELTNGAVSRTYTYGLQRISEEQPISSVWTPSFYGYDGGGNVRQLTDSAATVINTYEYDAYGNSFTVSGSTPNEFMYRGEQLDSDLELYYLRARYYDPPSGRFMSRDPGLFCNCFLQNPAASHAYVYANENPINLEDPLGRAANPIPLPGPEPVPNPTPESSRNSNSGVSVEYALIAGEISLGAVAFVPPVAEEVNCMLYTAAATLKISAQALNAIIVDRSNCTAVGLKYIPLYGDRPAPFRPLEVVTAPGSPWKCETEEDCEAPCPPGSKRTHENLHWDPGYYGEPPHWDYTDCNGDTWKIYLDGTMGPG